MIPNVKTNMRVNWTRTRAVKRAKIARGDYDPDTRAHYAYTVTLEEATEDMEGIVHVEVDVDAIVQRIVHAAAHNPGGTATALRGLIKAKRTNERVLSSKTKLTPMPAGYTEFDPSEVKEKR